MVYQAVKPQVICMMLTAECHLQHYKVLYLLAVNEIFKIITSQLPIIQDDDWLENPS